MGIGYTGMFLQKNQQSCTSPPLTEGRSTCRIHSRQVCNSLVQNVRQNDGTFGEIAAVVHSMMFKEGTYSSQIDIVFDTYIDMSIKNVERTLRGDDQGIQLQKISETQLVKQWKKCLR